MVNLDRFIQLKSVVHISDKGFFIIIFIYQCLLSLQGIDFADEGFFATFYQQIFRDPESVTLNFLHWFTGMIGGSFFYVFPNAGLLGLRILGVTVVSSTIAIVYYLLKNYLNLFNLRLGILLLVLFISNDIKEMYYDNVSALLSIVSASFLFYGLKGNNLFKIGLSGAFVSLNMFSRVPSVIMLIFFIAIVFNGFLNNIKFKYQLKQVFSFFIGFSFLTISILVLMKLIGHLSIYADSLSSMLSWGGSEYDNHNIYVLLKLFIRDYSSSILYGFVILTFVIILSMVQNYFFVPFKSNFKFLIYIACFALVLFTIYLTISQKITWLYILRVLVGISLIVSALLLVSKSDKNLKLLVFLGLLIIIFGPLGSAGGLFAMGRNCLWLVFPITLDYIFNTKHIETRIFLVNKNQENILDLNISSLYLKRARNCFVVVLISISLYYTYYYPYFDKNDRVKMHYSVENKFVKGIFTSKERANVINELLLETNKYVRKGDYILAYDNIPMIHFLTETRPFLNNSWPWLYVPEAFKAELDISTSKSKKLPIVIVQKMNTLDSDWPTNSLNFYQKSISDLMRDSILKEYLRRNNYKKVWENSTFEILISNN
jgi:hypothetical protein